VLPSHGLLVVSLVVVMWTPTMTNAPGVGFGVPAGVLGGAVGSPAGSAAPAPRQGGGGWGGGEAINGIHRRLNVKKFADAKVAPPKVNASSGATTQRRDRTNPCMK